MSSFNSPHHIYLFEMRNGKKKLSYGETPADAYENLRLRLSELEMNEVIEDRFLKILQRELHNHVEELG